MLRTLAVVEVVAGVEGVEGSVVNIPHVVDNGIKHHIHAWLGCVCCSGRKGQGAKMQL